VSSKNSLHGVRDRDGRYQIFWGFLAYHNILKGLCHQFRINFKKILISGAICQYLGLFNEINLTVSLICNGPLKFLCLGSKIIQNYHFHFKCAMSCSKRILICSMRILNMQEKLYFHHKVQLCSSMRLCDKIEQLPPFWMRIEQHLALSWCR
jgi:hypothetical protein